MENVDVLIIGAGLAGSALAAALRATPLRLALLDARPPSPPGEQWDARIYAVSPSSARFLAAIGIWSHLEASRLTAIYRMEIHGDRGGRLDFSAFEAGVEQLAWIVESNRIQWEMWQALRRQSNLSLICPATPAALRLDDLQAEVELADGRRIAARLVVGADGAESWLRARAGIGARAGAYGELGVVANLRAGRPHLNTAFQWFRDDGVLAWLPLGEGEISVVWSAPMTTAEELCSLDPHAFCARVEAAGRGRLGTMTALSGPRGFPLRILRANAMAAPRIALIGDAAHTLHPLSGHGINLGFQDARALAGVLQSMPRQADPGELAVLRRFERARAEEILALQVATHGLHRLFAARSAPLTWLRNVGMNLTRHTAVVRNALARYAMG